MTQIISFITGPAKKPLLILIAISLVFMALATAYFQVEKKGYNQGYTVAENKYLLEKEQAVNAAVNAVNEKNELNNQVSKEYWEKKLAQQPKIQTVEKRIIEYVESNSNDVCMLDDDELLILTELTNIANGNTEAADRPGIIAALSRNSNANRQTQKRTPVMEEEINYNVR